MSLPVAKPGPADSSAIANQESLSILEVEMRKLEAVTKEILDEMGYLQRREMKMRDTNGESAIDAPLEREGKLRWLTGRKHKRAGQVVLDPAHVWHHWSGRMAGELRRF